MDTSVSTDAPQEAVQTAVPPVEHWSHTCLSLYARCPRAWYCAYIQRVPAQESEVCIRGRLVHEFCEAYAVHCIRTGRHRDWDWAREQARGYEQEDVRRLAVDFAMQVEFNPDLVIADAEGVEREIAADLPYGLGRFVGRVDLVEWAAEDRALFITDYKSSHRSCRRPDEAPAQLVMYAWALLQSPAFASAREVTVRQHYIGSGTTHEWFLDADSCRPDWAVALVRRILADKRFEATPSPRACAWCDYSYMCSIIQANPLYNPSNRAEAEAALRQVTVREAELARLRRGLAEWTKEHGEIIAGGKAAGQKPPQSVEEDQRIHRGEYVLVPGARKSVLERALAEAGADPELLAEVFDPPPDPKGLGRLFAQVQELLIAERDPFGDGDEEEDPREAAWEWAQTMVVPRVWDGRRRFRIDDVPEEEPSDEETPDEETPDEEASSTP